MSDNIQDMTFQVSVKGLFFDQNGKIMMVQESDGTWEIPGGRVQKSEDLLEGLRRECMEETGLECTVLDNRPLLVYSAVDDKDRARLMVFYKVSFVGVEAFTPSEECVHIAFHDIQDIKTLPTVSQLAKLPELLPEAYKPQL